MFTLKSDRKIFLKWWLLAAIIYLLFSIIVTWHYGVNFLMPLSDDTVHHIQLAKNLINYGTFSLDGLSGKYETLPPKPTNFLTPGYALWLALIYLIFHSFTPAIFIGALIFALAVPLTYFLAEEIVDNKKISFWTAAIFMFEPLSIYHSGLLFTEQIFVPLFLFGIYCFVKYIKSGNLKFLSGSLIAFSVATLVRPILFYFLPLLVLIVVFKELKISWRRAAVLGALSVFLIYSFAGTWIIRNKIVLNTWQISSNQGAICCYHYELLMRNSGKVPTSPKEISDNQDAFSVNYNKQLEKFAVGEILNHKVEYLKLRLAYLPLFFVSNGYDNIVKRFTSTPGLDKYFRSDLVLAFLKGNFSGLKTMLGMSGLVFLAGAFLWIIISILALLGLWRLLISESGIDRRGVVFAVFLIVYFALVITPMITARYRLPINPLIFIFAITGAYQVKHYFSKNA